MGVGVGKKQRTTGWPCRSRWACVSVCLEDSSQAQASVRGDSWWRHTCLPSRGDASRCCRRAARTVGMAPSAGSASTASESALAVLATRWWWRAAGHTRSGSRCTRQVGCRTGECRWCVSEGRGGGGRCLPPRSSPAKALSGRRTRSRRLGAERRNAAGSRAAASGSD